MIPWLFAGVQKLLQVGIFFLLSPHMCSPLFVWVGVSVGVRTTGRLASQSAADNSASRRLRAFGSTPGEYVPFDVALPPHRE
jgi:hypothetical protein